MNKRDILTWFEVNSMELSAVRILMILAAGLAVAGVIFAVYYVTYSGVNYSFRFNYSNVVILLITIVIMLMISSNVVISLGMVGALSIVRFRTAIKDPKDTVFIFWSIVEGLCIGSQNLKLAFLSAGVIALVILGFSFCKAAKNSYLLILRGTGIKEDEVAVYLQGRTRRYRIRTINQTDRGVEIVYEVRAKGELSLDMSEDIKKITGVQSVNWLLESGETVG